MATTASAGSHTLRPNELEVYVKFIGAGGFGEIHCVCALPDETRINSQIRNSSTRQAFQTHMQGD